MSARIINLEERTEGLQEAARRLRMGKLVAFPTETVYGLGASALDPEAVQRIFRAKGRPASNPVIVHILSTDQAQSLVSAWPESAELLARTFWPGPLTLVLPRSERVPDAVTAGGATVGLRLPAHPVAQALLEAAGIPIAAPSANRSESISPTTARHVAESLGGYVDDLLILDGGPCQVGIESTVVDLTGALPRILRPGMITGERIAAALGRRAEGQKERIGLYPPQESAVARSPGQMPRHYAPRIPLALLPLEAIAEAGPGLVSGEPVALVFFSPLLPEEQWNRILPPVKLSGLPDRLRWLAWLGEGSCCVQMPPTPELAARSLYSNLRALEQTAAVRILVELPPTGAEWAAFYDRLLRASAS